MGLDFIRRSAGQPFTKAWKDGVNRLAAPTLFDLATVEPPRRVIAHPLPHENLNAGQEVIVHMQGPLLGLFVGLRQVATVDAPPSELFASVRDASGVALGVIERVSLFGNALEVSIR